MTHKTYNILFLSTGHSTCSVFGASIVNRIGGGRFVGYSAGSHTIHPLALETLRRNHYPTAGLCCQDWSQFAAAAAPRMDFVLTVGDRAAAAVCPVWPGQPMTAHWGMHDPAAVVGDELMRVMAFRRAFRELENRIKSFVSLPLASLHRLTLQRQRDAIEQWWLTEGHPGGDALNDDDEKIPDRDEMARLRQEYHCATARANWRMVVPMALREKVTQRNIR
jgi:protein-tyrosine-phosphatase